VDKRCIYAGFQYGKSGFLAKTGQIVPALLIFATVEPIAGRNIFFLLIQGNMAQILGLQARRSIKLWGIILGSVQNCLFISFDLGFCGFFPLRVQQGMR